MANIKKFNEYEVINEASPKLPTSFDYWDAKGKDGKNVALYTHDDMDGIFSALAVKKYLLERGFNIVKYGLINYQEGWKYTTLDPDYINIVVDYASMPESEREHLIDFYVDHHGAYTEEEKKHFKDSPVIKTDTGSAYEGIARILGQPINQEFVEVIDMIDSAKYDYYGIDWRDILPDDDNPYEINWAKIKAYGPKKAKLAFAALFNQFLKRGDHKTILEVIHNVKEPSIYAIYNAMKKLYPGNNPSNKFDKRYPTGTPKPFVPDALNRLNLMKQKTRGKYRKTIFKSTEQFDDRFPRVDVMRKGELKDERKIDGYQIINNLVYVPTGTWANALRARQILLKDYDNGVIPKDHEIKFILMEYGNTLQVVAFEDISKMDVPTLKNGEEVRDLGKYMTQLLNNFQQHLGYYDPDTSLGQEEITVSGGHGGIGTVSNIITKIKHQNKFPLTKNFPEGMKFHDLFKNKIIKDLSGINWNLNFIWKMSSDSKNNEPEMNNKVMMAHKMRKINPQGKIETK